MFTSLSTVLNNNKNCKNGGAYWNRGAYLQKHILWGGGGGGAYLEGGAYWKEVAKSNHYGNSEIILKGPKFKNGSFMFYYIGTKFKRYMGYWPCVRSRWCFSMHFSRVLIYSSIHFLYSPACLYN